MDWVSLLGIIVAPVAGVISWIAGTRSRRNKAIKELMETIQLLVTRNNECNQRIIELQKEVIEVRKENSELKSGQEQMTRKLSDLQQENADLWARIIRTKKVPVPKKTNK